MAHHCIANPCWICYPEFAPKQQPSFQLSNNNISSELRELLISVFKQGLDEDQHFRAMGDDLDLERVKRERSYCNSNSFEAQLLDLLIEDCEDKSV